MIQKGFPSVFYAVWLKNSLRTPYLGKNAADPPTHS